MTSPFLVISFLFMTSKHEINFIFYSILLFQVEAALTTDPSNEELLKLKIDLEEVIELTHDLIKSQQQEKRQANGMDAKDPILLAVLANKWKVGDQCMAPWSEDGK